jgi:glyoxylase-like metal-dependent hydrolase (beta-lactamase superfamily II)
VLRSVLAPNPSPMTLDGTRTYIVGRQRPAVIDPGPADAGHLDAVVRMLEGHRPAAILLTHGHSDHAYAAPALARRTGAPVLMGRGALRLPFARRELAGWLGDGDAVQTDAGALVAVATPGHAPEHLGFVGPGQSATERALFAGDTFMGGSDTTLVAPPEGDLTAYLESLDRIASLSADVIYPAHGPPLRSPAEAVRRYRAHRLERIDGVVRALRRGPSSAAGLVDRVYGPELHPTLRGAAAGSVAAVLAHLEAARRVERRRGGLYRLTA